MLIIPLFRAKKIDSNEYVIGFYSSAYDIHHYVITHLGVDTKTSTVYQMSTSIHKIDPTTISINFPDMLDSQGNKIFASLSEDGKGGDIMKDDDYYGIAKYKDSRFVVEYENVEECLYEGNFEVVGVQK